MASARAFVFVTALTVALAARSTGASAQPHGVHPPRWWFNLDVEVGAALRPDDSSWFFHPRVRVGPTRFRNWQFLNLSATAETFNLDRVAFGLLVGIDDVDYGVSAYAGAHLSTAGDPGATLGVGWKWFTVEGQVHFEHEARWLVAAGLRVPVGAILMALLAPPTTMRMPAPR